MTWEETILYVREINDYQKLVQNSYLTDDLISNIEKYRKSEEFKEVLRQIRSYQPRANNILDVGSGNGITCISLALEGYNVTAVEPDPSNTVGCGAIRYLKGKYNLDSINVYQGFCEDINFDTASFDVVFARQCMHHANDLKKFVREMGRVLKRNGLFFTIRDHVIFSPADKELFLKEHPLQKFYLGENAFLPQEYRKAIKDAGLKLVRELKYYDSVINYFPRSSKEIYNLHNKRLEKISEQMKLKSTNEIVAKLLFWIYILKNGISKVNTYSELKIPGRMYSYIAIKG